MSMEQIVDHKVNDGPDLKTFKIREATYHARWSKKPSIKDTREPIHHISRRPLVEYYDKRSLLYLPDVINALVTR